MEKYKWSLKKEAVLSKSKQGWQARRQASQKKDVN